MGRGVSSGGGQSSLGYLFGSGEAPKPATNAPTPPPAENNGPVNKAQPIDHAKQVPARLDHGKQVPAGLDHGKQVPAGLDHGKQVPAGIHGNLANNYFRADGQNSGNFITDRPSTKVHSAPGGGSSLGYLFGTGGPGSDF